jgi:hypothetical protein
LKSFNAKYENDKTLISFLLNFLTENLRSARNFSCLSSLVPKTVFLRFKKTKKSNKQAGYTKPTLQKQHTQHKRDKRTQNPSSQKTIKQLLGELYADRVYLEQLLDDNGRLPSIS